MTLRLVRAEHSEVVSALDRAIFPGDEPLGPKDAAVWWVAYDGHKPVGYCCASAIGAGLTYLVRAGVLPSHRRRGLYRRMVRVVCAWGATQRADTVITYTITDNDASSNCLIRSGFLLYHPEWAWVGRDGVLYWKRDGRG